MSFSVDRIIARAERLAKAGDIEQAASLYGAVLEKFPQNTRAKDGLAVLAKEARSSRAAAGALDKHLGALIALFNEGRHQAVIEQAESLTHAYPQAARLYNILGAANAALGRNEAALSSYAKAVECEPGLAIAHNNLGNVLSAPGRRWRGMTKRSGLSRNSPRRITMPGARCNRWGVTKRRRPGSTRRSASGLITPKRTIISAAF